MATPANPWKLGLFVVTTFVTAAVVLAWLGAQALAMETVGYRSYYDESVQGLEVGSPVKFRGVTIGNVAYIDVAPDRRHVEVGYEIAVKTVTKMGLAKREWSRTRMTVPPDTRAQIASAGITGVKFLEIDFFDPKQYPAPVLPFQTPENMIPATPSTMKNLEDSVVRTVNQFPELAAQVLGLLERANRMMADIEKQELPAHAKGTLARVDGVLGEVHGKVRGLDTDGLSKSAVVALADLDETVKRLDAVVKSVEQPKGLLANASRATEAVTEAARSARGAGRQMDETLRDMREAADAVKRLADVLEQDPDMLLKGRATRPTAEKTR